jgi:hypothetical protein
MPPSEPVQPGRVAQLDLAYPTSTGSAGVIPVLGMAMSGLLRLGDLRGSQNGAARPPHQALLATLHSGRHGHKRDFTVDWVLQNSMTRRSGPSITGTASRRSTRWSGSSEDVTGGNACLSVKWRYGGRDSYQQPKVTCCASAMIRLCLLLSAFSFLARFRGSDAKQAPDMVTVSGTDRALFRTNRDGEGHDHQVIWQGPAPEPRHEAIATSTSSSGQRQDGLSSRAEAAAGMDLSSLVPASEAQQGVTARRSAPGAVGDSADAFD